MSRGPPEIEGMTSLKVDNLTFRTTPEDLRKVFEKYGDVGDVYIPRNRFTKESRGFAFVRFFDRRDGEDAEEKMDGAILDGRELRVQMARYGRPEPRRFPRSRYGGGRDGGGGGRSRYGSGGGGRYRSRSRSPRRRSYRSRSRSRSGSRGRRTRSRSRSHERRSRSRSLRKSHSHSRSRSPSNRGSKSPHD